MTMSFANNRVLCLLATWFISISALAAEQELATKNPNDLRQFRAITLANEMEALLISDPTFNKSAAAIDIAVGDHEDPADKLGMAHFLEHVLFLGTKTYPVPDEFAAFLEANQGDWNAYTASESTNFHFDINHDAFEGALERFSLFFREPTFNPEFFPKERKAVNSEYMKNLDSDESRTFSVFQKILNQDHPASRFTIGSEETLGKASVEDMASFFKKQYSANRMKLCMLSKRPLDEMEALAKKYFAPVMNNRRPENSYSKDYLDLKKLPAELHVQTLKDVKKLEIGFPIPPTDPLWRTKPHAILGHLFGHEGSGSLLSFLKKNGLASGIYTSVPATTYASTFETTIQLTDKGFKNIDHVVEAFFQYLAVIKKSGYQRYIFDEEKTMRSINLLYRDKLEGVEVASNFANLMQRVPALEVEKQPYLLYEYSESDFNNLIGLLKPERMWILVSSNSIKTNATDKFYKAKYSIHKIDENRIKKFSNVAITSGLKLPEPNTFIPKKLETVVAADTKAKEIISQEAAVGWFQGDNELKLPKAGLSIDIITEETNRTPQDKVLSNLYVESLERTLAEWKYMISLAGLSYTVSRTDRSINLAFMGYSENLLSLATVLAGKLKTIDIPDHAFEDAKDELKRSIRNAFLSDAYKQASFQLSYLTDKSMIHPRSYLSTMPGDKKVDLVSKVTLTDVKNYATKSLYENVGIEAAAYGSLKESDVAAALSQIIVLLNAKPIAKSKWIKPASLALDRGQKFAIQSTSLVSNAAWIANFQFGERTPHTHAILAIGNSFLKPAYFRELRTNQQLGYVVASWLQESRTRLGMNFLIQSDSYNPNELASRTAAWMGSAVKSLRDLPQQEFDQLKASVATEFRRKMQTIPEKLDRLVFEALYLEGMFGYHEAAAKEAEALTRDEVANAFAAAFDANSSATISVYLDTKKTPKYKPNEALIQNASEFKATHTYR
jgi:insulysin